jgi:hypothetical protein
MQLAYHASVSLSIHQLHSTACRTFSQQLFGEQERDPLPVERFHISGHGVLSGMRAMIRNNLNVLPKEPNLFENPDSAKHVLMGHVMYEVFKRIVEPICKQHPSLRPPEMED